MSGFGVDQGAGAASAEVLRSAGELGKARYAAAGQTLRALGYHVECRGWLPVLGWYRLD
jgi:hypothetical protein